MENLHQRDEAVPVDPNHLVLLSDTHCAPGLKHQLDFMRKSISEIVAMNPRPGHVLIYGDFAFLYGKLEDYKLLKESTELARKQIALTGWSNGPSFSVYHQYNGRHNFSDEPTMNMTPPNMLGAQLNIPIFTFGKTYAAIKDARLSYKKQLNTLEDTELAPPNTSHLHFTFTALEA